jgi:hypothetical protein
MSRLLKPGAMWGGRFATGKKARRAATGAQNHAASERSYCTVKGKNGLRNNSVRARALWGLLCEGEWQTIVNVKPVPVTAGRYQYHPLLSKLCH